MGNEVITTAGSSARLLNIRIERWGTQKFSGLLGLQNGAGGLYYVLLDATGVKLLEGQLSAGENNHSVSGVLKESGIADFLVESLERIFLFEPSQRPCSRNWLLQICSKKMKESRWLKSFFVGPFTLWQAVARHMGEKRGRVIVYSQPWLGVRIFVEDINSTL